MSELVGNSLRGDIPGNSLGARAAQAPKEERPKTEKVITGKVIIRKPPFWKRIAHSMVADDVSNVGDFVVTDVLVPAIRNLIFEIINQGSSRVLYGASKNRPGVGVRSGLGPVSSLKLAHAQATAADPRNLPQEARARHDFDPIILPTRGDAVAVIEELAAMIVRYNQASVSDLYDLLGVTGAFTDQRWGWTDLTSADVRQVRDGFLLDLPRPIQLR